MILRFLKLRNIIIIFIILCGLSFFKLAAIGKFSKLAEIAGFLIIFIVFIIHIIYDPSKGLIKNFNRPITLIFISVLISMIIPYYTYNQTFIQTAYAQRFVYFYLLYYLLHFLKPSIKDIESIIIGLAFLYFFLYLLQFFLYPKIIFNVWLNYNRGTVRAFLPGTGFLIIAYFMFITYFFRTNHYKYLIFSILLFSILILMGGRQTLAITTFVTIMGIIFLKKVKSKFALIFLISLSIIPLYFIFNNIFIELFTATQRTKEIGFDNIRIRALIYFLTEGISNNITYIVGNGAPFAESLYGKFIFNSSLYYGFHLGDIGVFGNYYQFGILFLIGIFSIIFKTFRLQFGEEYSYIKLYMFASLIALPTGGGFAKLDYAISLSCLLFIMDYSITRKITQPDNKIADE